MEPWLIGLAANATIAAALLAVAVVIAMNLTKGRQWFVNPLAAATVFLFITCGGGHAVYAMQLMDNSIGLATEAGAAIRFAYLQPHMWGWDIMTAAAGVWYWTMRRKFPDLVSGAAVFEDLRGRQRRALEIHDNVVQGLVRAQLALELSREGEAKEAVDATLARAEAMVTDLLATAEQNQQGGAGSPGPEAAR